MQAASCQCCEQSTDPTALTFDGASAQTTECLPSHTPVMKVTAPVNDESQSCQCIRPHYANTGGEGNPQAGPISDPIDGPESPAKPTDSGNFELYVGLWNRESPEENAATITSDGRLLWADRWEGFPAPESQLRLMANGDLEVMLD